MSVTTRWKLRTENNCLFVDDVSVDKVVLQHNDHTGNTQLTLSIAR